MFSAGCLSSLCPFFFLNFFQFKGIAYSRIDEKKKKLCVNTWECVSDLLDFALFIYNIDQLLEFFLLFSQIRFFLLFLHSFIFHTDLFTTQLQIRHFHPRFFLFLALGEIFGVWPFSWIFLTKFLKLF